MKRVSAAQILFLIFHFGNEMTFWCPFKEKKGWGKMTTGVDAGVAAAPLLISGGAAATTSAPRCGIICICNRGSELGG